MILWSNTNDSARIEDNVPSRRKGKEGEKLSQKKGGFGGVPPGRGKPFGTEERKLKKESPGNFKVESEWDPFRKGTKTKGLPATTSYYVPPRPQKKGGAGTRREGLYYFCGSCGNGKELRNREG